VDLRGLLIIKNMEIFRTDGSGRSYTNERLFNLVKNVNKNTLKGFFDNILIINDHKGDLYVNLKDVQFLDIDYYYSVFKTFWYLENEYNVKILVNEKIIKETEYERN
jgi:hypothetical protein